VTERHLETIVLRVLAAIGCLSLFSNTAATFESVDDSRQWALTGLTIIDVISGDMIPDQTIVVKNGVIQSIGNDLPVGNDETILIDHAGHYAIPGLWDMHVHIRGGPESIEANRQWLPQYLAFGVTSVRDAGGDLYNSVLHWKSEVEQGTLQGPRIYSALRKIDGTTRSQSGAIQVESAADVRSALDYLTLASADFVKTYDFSLPRGLYLRAIREAETRGLKTSAHIPPWVPFEELIDAGLDSVEHSFALGKAGNPDDRRISRAIAPDVANDWIDYFGILADNGDTYDEATAQRSFSLMIRNESAIDAVLHFEHLILSHLVGAGTANPRRKETPEVIRDTHDEALEFMTSIAGELTPLQRRIVEQADRLVRAAADAGVMILVGTDTGVNNPLLYPGDSLHAEMEALASIGITPLEVLRSATVNAARWMDVYPRFGSISPGAVADIVILESNPIDDIRSTRTLTAVVQQGVYFDFAELEQLKRLREE
jgi:imidazolonepropionase-like amidohydrolase